VYLALFVLVRVLRTDGIPLFLFFLADFRSGEVKGKEKEDKKM